MTIAEWEDRFCKPYMDKTKEDMEIADDNYDTYIFADGSFMQFCVCDNKLVVGRTYGKGNMYRFMKMSYMLALFAGCSFIVTLSPRNAKAYAKLTGSTFLGEVDTEYGKQNYFIISTLDMAREVERIGK